MLFNNFPDCIGTLTTSEFSQPHPVKGRKEVTVSLRAIILEDFGIPASWRISAFLPLGGFRHSCLRAASPEVGGCRCCNQLLFTSEEWAKLLFTREDGQKFGRQYFGTDGLGGNDESSPPRPYCLTLNSLSTFCQWDAAISFQES